MPTIQLDEVESRTLVTIHNFERACAGVEAPFQKMDSMVAPGWEDSVPKYLIYAVVQGKMGVSHMFDTPVDRAFHSLEKLGLIEHSPPKFGRLLTGRWTLPDGRTIETRGKCAEHPRGGPFWELEVFIDGTRAFGLSGPPDLTFMPFPQYGCYRLTREGLVVVRAQAATDKRPAKKPRQKPKARRRKRQPRQPDAEMMEVHTAHKRGLSFRAIAADRKRHGKRGTSPTTIGEWVGIADAFLNPKSRSKRVRHRLPEDHRGQTDLSEDRRRDSGADDGD